MVGEVGIFGRELGGWVLVGVLFLCVRDGFLRTVSPKCLLTRPPKGWKPEPDLR